MEKSKTSSFLIPPPDQGEARVGSAEDSEPERKLLQAILQDAIECWQAFALTAPAWRVSAYSPLGKRQREYHEAEFWLFGAYNNAPLFSFNCICDCLGLDPEFIRRRLLEWKSRAAAGDPLFDSAAAHEESRKAGPSESLPLARGRSGGDF